VTNRRVKATLRGGRRDWYRIQAKADDDRTAVVDLYDEIGWFGVEASEFVRELRELDVDDIELHVNSPGGDVFDAIAILNALRSHPARVTATVDGLAASAASFITVGSDEVVMARNSEMMIHDPLGLVIGNAADMRDLADRLDKIADNMASIYQDKAGGELADWRAAMRAETWYSAQEAVEAGLADRVDAESDDEASAQAKARFDLSVFAYAGRRAAPAPQTPAAPAGGPTPTPQEGSPAVAFSDEQLLTMRQQLGLADDADEATILAALTEALEERADPGQQQTTPTLPDGVVAIDREQLEALQTTARRGEQARTQQEREQREQLVAAAVADGRIPPARREAWLAQLEADPGSAETLASLQPGLVPVGAEIGSSSGAPDADDALYTACFGKES
jgi:ATP-dependent Clp endopeptidase proteolytic subunit ClpP